MMLTSRVDKKKECILLVAVLLLCSLMICGFGEHVELDTEAIKVYQNINIDEIIQKIETEKDEAKKLYHGNYYFLDGYITSIKSNSKEIFISANRENATRVICCKISDKSTIEKIKGLEVEEFVRIYGRLTIGLDKNVNVKIDHIEKTGNALYSNDMYSTIDGKQIEKSSMAVRELNNGSFRYYIPSSWISVEHNIKEEELGSIEGYQYCLNQTDPKEALSESLFVCCLDKKDVDINDRKDNKRIEEAIIRDIMGKKDKRIEKFPLKKTKTYYGAQYIYYRDHYAKDLFNDKYNVEMIFQETDKEIIVVLYLYNKKTHLDEIMITLRMMELLS